MIAAAHAAGLLIHSYTFRNDSGGYGFFDPAEEMAYYMRLGVDGVFTDFTDTGVAAVASIPEPGSYALMLAGLAGVCWVARRRAGARGRRAARASSGCACGAAAVSRNSGGISLARKS